MNELILKKWIEYDLHQEDPEITVSDIIAEDVDLMNEERLKELLFSSVRQLPSVTLAHFLEAVSLRGMNLILSAIELVQYIVCVRYVDSVGYLLSYACHDNVEIALSAPAEIIKLLSTEMNEFRQQRLAYALWIIFCGEMKSQTDRLMGYASVVSKKQLNSVLIGNSALSNYAKDILNRCASSFE